MTEHQGQDPTHTVARVSAALSALFLLILTGGVAYHSLEPWTWIQSFYFTVSTLATVGYGDLHPSSDASRLFTTFFILGGVAVAITALGVLGTAYLERRAIRIVERRGE